jgi:hypothetical protein
MQTAKVATSQASTSDSPVRKRVKSVDDSVAAPPPIQAKAKKAAAPERKQTTPRHSKAPAKKPAAAPAHDTKAKASQKDDVEVGFEDSEQQAQDRQVFKAIAGHAAATAAVKRYNLRSANRD